MRSRGILFRFRIRRANVLFNNIRQNEEGRKERRTNAEEEQEEKKKNSHNFTISATGFRFHTPRVPVHIICIRV